MWPYFSLDHSWEDGYFYIELARSLGSLKWQLLGDFHLKYLPGYPALIALVHALALGALDLYGAAKLSSALSSALLPPVCYLLVLDYSGRRDAGLAAAFISMFNAHLVLQGGIPWSEALFALQAAATLLLMRRAPWLAGPVAGWAIVTRHEGWFLLAALAAGIVFDGERRKGLVASFCVAWIVGAGWWLFAHERTGTWLHELYATEDAERASELGRVGPGFVLLSFPVAGHLASLAALLSAPAWLRERRVLPALVFFALYWALHGWWMFRVERYFIVLAPLVHVLAGVGLAEAARLLAGKFSARDNSARTGLGKRLGRFVLPSLGLVIGLSHFIGFFPAMLHEESVRTSGYYRALEWVGEQPGRFSVIAYEALMAGYHLERPVIPSGSIPADNWMDYVPRLYAEQGARYLVWCDFYPGDRAKAELASGEPLYCRGRIKTPRGDMDVTIELAPVKTVRWLHEYPRTGWVRPWRSEVQRDASALVYKLELIGIAPADP